MAKDFAHRNGGGRQATSGSRAPGWVWLLVGVAIGFVAAAGYYVTRPTAGTGAAVAEADGKARDGGKKKITIPPKEPSRFAFYELLPSYEVVIPKESLKETTPKEAPATPGERYLVQVGSFKDRREAEQQKANLALIGIESKIESVTIDGRETWYRVRIGPEADRARVETILARLDENNIKAMVVKVPH